MQHEGHITGAAEAVAHSLLSRGIVPDAKGVADYLALALNFLIKAALGRLFRRLARSADRAAPQRLARLQLQQEPSAPAESLRVRTPAIGKSAEPRETWRNALLPSGFHLKLRLVPLPNQRAARPPAPQAPSRSPVEPADRNRPRWRWENLGKFRLCDPPEEPPAPAAACEASRPAPRPRRDVPPLRGFLLASRPDDAAGRPRRLPGPSALSGLNRAPPLHAHFVTTTIRIGPAFRTSTAQNSQNAGQKCRVGRALASHPTNTLRLPSARLSSRCPKH